VVGRTLTYFLLLLVGPDVSLTHIGGGQYRETIIGRGLPDTASPDDGFPISPSPMLVWQCGIGHRGTPISGIGHREGQYREGYHRGGSISGTAVSGPTKSKRNTRCMTKCVTPLYVTKCINLLAKSTEFDRRLFRAFVVFAYGARTG